MEDQNANQQPGSAQQPQEQPAPAASPSAPEKKKSPLKMILIIVGGLFVVGIIVIVLLVVLVFNAAKGVSKEADAFVADIASSNYTDAYGYFSSELKDVQSQSEFESQAGTLNLDSGCALKVDSAEASTSGGQTAKKVTGKVNCSDKSYDASFTFVKVGDDYKLYSYQIQ